MIRAASVYQLGCKHAIENAAHWHLKMVQQHFEIELGVMKNFDRLGRREYLTKLRVVERVQLKQVEDERAVRSGDLKKSHTAAEGVKPCGFRVNAYYGMTGNGSESLFQACFRRYKCVCSLAH
jgi:hypothetical protein